MEVFIEYCIYAFNGGTPMDNIVSVSVLVFRDENILFVKSYGPRGAVKLTLPGGRLVGNENIEECAVRQVYDTAGIRITLDKRLSGVITRRNKKGSFLVTFIYLAEALDTSMSGRAVFIPYNDVKYYREISEFSKLIIEKLKLSSLHGMDRDELKGADGKEYLMYF